MYSDFIAVIVFDNNIFTLFYLILRPANERLLKERIIHIKLFLFRTTLDTDWVPQMKAG